MIKSITSAKHIEVSNGYASDLYINNNGQPMTGMVRYSNNYLETYDGTSWHKLNQTYPTIGLTQSATAAIDWAIKQMQEQAELEKMSKDHPAIQAAYDNFRRSAEQLKVTIMLSKEQENKSPWEELQANFP